MKRTITCFTLIVLLIITVSFAVAQSGGGYDLTWSTTDGGGGTSIGGSYALMGTLGQPDARAMSGGGYTLAGGLWVSGIGGLYRVYLPLMLRNP